MGKTKPGPRANAADKPKYGSGPLMRVQKQFRNAQGSSYQVITPQSLHQRKIVFRTDNLSVQDRPDVGSNVSAPPHPDSTPHHQAPPTSATEHAFVINTAANMRHGRQAGREPPQLLRQSTEEMLLPREPKRKALFKPSRPLQNSDQINSDIWQTILGYCEPQLLLEAKTINSGFHRLLADRSGIWRQSRQIHFGSDMPDLPHGLTEQQYVDLLVGRGCQSRNCHRERIARVCWEFRVRLCSDCFRSKVMRADDLSPHRRHVLPYDLNEGMLNREEIRPPDSMLWDLLPQAISDGRRYVHPRVVTRTTNTWAGWSGLRSYVFLRSAYAQLESAYLELRRSNPDNNPVTEAWIRDKHSSNMTIMADAEIIDKWRRRQQLALSDPVNRLDRHDFFAERAEDLSPPIDYRMLDYMAAFRKALKVDTPPTERSWTILKKKILPYRSQAQQVDDFNLLMMQNPHASGALLDRFVLLREHRFDRKRFSGVYLPEQDFVLELGEKEFVRCLAAGVADEDLLLLCLKNVFDEYAQLSVRPSGLNFDGTTGPYCLSLDDARMIVHLVMEKHIASDSQRGSVVFRKLKCRGCTRTDFTKTWSFEEAFEHMLITHAQLVGEGLEFWQFAVPFPHSGAYWTLRRRRGEDDTGDRFPWYTVPWPRCLPLVPFHQDVCKMDKWHPAVIEPFVRKESPPSISAFEGRRARLGPWSEADFPENLAFAVKTLTSSRLDGLCQMKIALRYALDLYMKTDEGELVPSMLFVGFELIRSANANFDLRFKCGACVAEGTVDPGAKQVKYRLPYDALITHWEQRHEEEGISWTEALMHLPSDSEVLVLMTKADEKLQSEKDAARVREEKLAENVRKRPRLKGQVVIQARLARDAFDELFEPTSTPDRVYHEDTPF
ncbi:hypothetical protein LTR10_015459 [Elasticomyces elasticus]|uniref:F-box domain-containing protein n=1 Tax=Exophiala sideris TaxID=1016849 RepID=A0ABR0J3V2_9EURO|nr:hypothetical protein LTR10_015459 [Elasticomyces elasticus]KAK5026950.1 hypothetical protein LTS07_007249 [Exophiala sideris]KAK5033954.1 hypothetical protein LTR13_006554 [Exophiala sideris]KAK5055772.1 hypothetical protein LTR69_008147 [Exophiala sideris]KAK5180896.1 hypothetical protein LTR44_006716 [Eurotiomycetes sp. CCFEE 6388]